MKPIKLYVFIFLIFLVVIGFSIQEFAEPEYAQNGIQIIEEGGKITRVNLSDGVTGSQDNG